ncbi:MAG: hypothetical protein AVDCRST_MAG33-3219, partial [uncultured Thermomicrobiales bacterium]
GDRYDTDRDQRARADRVALGGQGGSGTRSLTARRTTRRARPDPV